MTTKQPLEVITTSTGYFRAGFHATIVDGGERTVFLGPDGNLKETIIPEFTLEFPPDAKGRRARREFCQYGRDFVFATPTPATR